MSTSAWRPPQWNSPVKYSVVISGAANAPASTFEADSTGGGYVTVAGVTTQMYVFDAVLTASHTQESHITEYAVQTGANISDHAYALPARVVLDVGMSDAMDAYASSLSTDAAAAAGAWTGTSSYKSVNAFQTISSWCIKRVLLTLNTRLKSYPSMLVESVAPEESSKTVAGLRCRVTFKQVFIANVAQVTGASARTQDTKTSNTGTVSGAPPSAAQTSQYGVTTPSTVPGAGTWTSVSESSGS